MLNPQLYRLTQNEAPFLQVKKNPSKLSDFEGFCLFLYEMLCA